MGLLAGVEDGNYTDLFNKISNVFTESKETLLSFLAHDLYQIYSTDNASCDGMIKYEDVTIQRQNYPKCYAKK